MRQLLSFLIAANVLLSTLLWMPDARANVAIKTEDGQSSVYREVLDRLASRHYRTQKVDDALSQRYLDEYIGLLDAGKNYFLQSDIDEFVSHAIQNPTFQKTETWGFLERKGYIDRIQSMGHQYEQSC